MAYEIFSRKVQRKGIPAVSITPYGRLAFNRPLVKILEDNAFERVLLLWDADRHRLAIRPITKNDPRSYQISFRSKESGVGVSIKTFLDHYDIDYSETRSIPAVLNADDMIVEVDLPPEMIKKEKAKQKVLKLESA